MQYNLSSKGVIRFYKVGEPYGEFSNFAPYPIFIEGQIWPTTEHYFQACKFDDDKIKSKILLMDSPMTAALEGRDKKNKIRDDWELIKEDKMCDALSAKFLQHPELRRKLIETNDFIIVEHTKNDSYWGNGGDDTGENRLGILIMNVREYIKKYSGDPSIVLPPWIAFPSISQFDLFWRMGLGENYLVQWSRFFLSTDKRDYKNKFPESKDWKDIYECDM